MIKLYRLFPDETPSAVDQLGVYMKKSSIILCSIAISAFSFHLYSKDSTKPYSDDITGPFPAITEQQWSDQDQSQADLQQLGILPQSIKVTPSLLELKIGSIPTYIHTSFEATGIQAVVDYEIFAPHLDDQEKSRVDANGRLILPDSLQNETEFLVRVRLRDNPEIFDDMIVIVRQ